MKCRINKILFLKIKVNYCYLKCGCCLAVENYGWLVDGTADERIRTFIDEEHTFDEYTEVCFMYGLLAKPTCVVQA